MKKFAVLFSLVLMALWSMSFIDPVSTKPWQHLGSRVVTYQLDKDVIHVGAREGGFTKLKLKVTGGGLNMHRLVVEYGNGQKDQIPLKHHFRSGDQSRIIDLEGGKRVIKDITFWYDTKNIVRRRGRIHVYGRR